MAHLLDDSTVDCLLVVQMVVALLKRVKSIGSKLKSLGILLDLALVVVDVTCVFLNVGLVLVTESLSILNSVLEISSGESEGLCCNEHIGGLSNLKLVVLSSEQGVLHLEALHLLREFGSEKRGSGSVPGVIVVVIMISSRVWVSVCLGSGDQKGSSKGFHCSLNFIDYKGCGLWTFYDLLFKFLTVFHKFYNPI